MNIFHATYFFGNEIVDHVAWKRHCAITKKYVFEFRVISTTHDGLSNDYRWKFSFIHHLLRLMMSFSLASTRQIWGIWKLRPAYSPETPNLGQNRLCFVPCDLEIWWMILENNRAPLLCCFKLCATFHSHRLIQTGVAVRKRPIWVKFYDF